MSSPVYSCSGVQWLTLAPDRGSTISIRNRQVNGCKVCVGSGSSQQCGTSREVKDGARESVFLNCNKPEDVFTVEISRNIGKSGRGQKERLQGRFGSPC